MAPRIGYNHRKRKKRRAQGVIDGSFSTPLMRDASSPAEDRQREVELRKSKLMYEIVKVPVANGRDIYYAEVTRPKKMRIPLSGPGKSKAEKKVSRTLARLGLWLPYTSFVW